MSLLQNVYDISPIFFQNIMTSVAGYQKNRTRYGKEYYKYRKFLKEFDNYSIEEKLEYQQNRLISFVKYAYNNSEFYNQLYKNL